MAKYYKFHYDAGYIGTEVEEVIKYDDDVSEDSVESDFEDWYEEQRTDSGYFEEMLGVDEY